jgi:uncharacterized protein YgbK (DUF1537 family)
VRWWTVTEDGEPTARVAAARFLAAQPELRAIENAMDVIRERRAARRERLLVLDDDPTGTQSVHGVPVLTEWSSEVLAGALRDASTVFVLTNSRSMAEPDAVMVSREIAERGAAIAAAEDYALAIASRSDSTLRGHFPTEPDAVAQALEAAGHRIDGVLLCPCFLEAGRITVDDVQWVTERDELVPSGQTHYATDRSFGYTASDLRLWVEEKSDGAVPADSVLSVGLGDIRMGGPDRVREILAGAKGRAPVVVNATEYSDLEVVVLGLLDAETAGQRFVYRCGPSFVRVRGGIEPAPPLTAEALSRQRPSGGHGLVLVGSHVETTTRQLEAALALEQVHGRELSVERLLEPEAREEELAAALADVARHLPDRDVILYTSRELARAEGSDEALDVGRSISAALVELVQRLDPGLPLSFCVAKGGITSSDVGARGFGVRRAEVAGQMLPGTISVWILPEDGPFPGLPYVIFPGNVGGDDTLAEVIERLRRKSG